MHPLEQLRDDALQEIEAARDEKSLEVVRVKYLGKSGGISEWGERMKTLGKEERPVVGKLLNEARNAVTAALDQRGEKVRAEKESDALASIDGMTFEQAIEHLVAFLYSRRECADPLASDAARRLEELTGCDLPAAWKARAPGR